MIRIKLIIDEYVNSNHESSNESIKTWIMMTIKLIIDK